MENLEGPVASGCDPFTNRLDSPLCVLGLHHPWMCQSSPWLCPPGLLPLPGMPFLRLSTEHSFLGLLPKPGVTFPEKPPRSHGEISLLSCAAARSAPRVHAQGRAAHLSRACPHPWAVKPFRTGIMVHFLLPVWCLG